MRYNFAQRIPVKRQLPVVKGRIEIAAKQFNNLSIPRLMKFVLVDLKALQKQEKKMAITYRRITRSRYNVLLYDTNSPSWSKNGIFWGILQSNIMKMV